MTSEDAHGANPVVVKPSKSVEASLAGINTEPGKAHDWSDREVPPSEPHSSHMSSQDAHGEESAVIQPSKVHRDDRVVVQPFNVTGVPLAPAGPFADGEGQFPMGEPAETPTQWLEIWRTLESMFSTEHWLCLGFVVAIAMDVIIGSVVLSRIGSFLSKFVWHRSSSMGIARSGDADGVSANQPSLSSLAEMLDNDKSNSSEQLLSVAEKNDIDGSNSLEQGGPLPSETERFHNDGCSLSEHWQPLLSVARKSPSVAETFLVDNERSSSSEHLLPLASASENVGNDRSDSSEQGGPEFDNNGSSSLEQGGPLPSVAEKCNNDKPSSSEQVVPLAFVPDSFGNERSDSPEQGGPLLSVEEDYDNQISSSLEQGGSLAFVMGELDNDRLSLPEQEETLRSVAENVGNDRLSSSDPGLKIDDPVIVPNNDTSDAMGGALAQLQNTPPPTCTGEDLANTANPERSQSPVSIKARERIQRAGLARQQNRQLAEKTDPDRSQSPVPVSGKVMSRLQRAGLTGQETQRVGLTGQENRGRGPKKKPKSHIDQSGAVAS